MFHYWWRVTPPCFLRVASSLRLQLHVSQLQFVNPPIPPISNGRARNPCRFSLGISVFLFVLLGNVVDLLEIFKGHAYHSYLNLMLVNVFILSLVEFGTDCLFILAFFCLILDIIPCIPTFPTITFIYLPCKTRFPINKFSLMLFILLRFIYLLLLSRWTTFLIVIKTIFLINDWIVHCSSNLELLLVSMATSLCLNFRS